MHGQIVSVLIPRQAVAPLGPLRLISFLSLGYVAFTALFLAATDQDPTLVSRGFVKAIPLFGGLMAPLTANWWGLSALELLLLCPATQRAIRTRGIEATFACCYALAITNCFSFVKNSMPLILPFWADPLLARIDATLHFGQSPRDFLTWLDAFSLHGLLEVYFSFWLPAALLLPGILALVDTDSERRRAFTWLWFATWVLLGNVLALALLSAGPIFYDHLPVPDPQRYSDVSAFVSRTDAEALKILRDGLWWASSTRQTAVGSGISAMPSVHVGMATVVALYVFERLADAAARLPRNLRPVGLLTQWAVPLAIVGTYQALSVWLGWHYAVDGYLSILVICVLARWMRRGPWRGRGNSLSWSRTRPWPHLRLGNAWTRRTTADGKRLAA